MTEIDDAGKPLLVVSTAPSPLSLCVVHSMYTPCGVHALLGRHLLMEATVAHSELELQHKHRHLHTDPATNTISYPLSLSSDF